MPVINGQVARSRFNSLKIGELSSVDNPAQPGARATIMKRHDGAKPNADTVAFIAKYIGCDDGAHSFNEVLIDNKFSQEIWPYTDALSQSIRSIVGDTAITGDQREEKITQSVSQFLAAVRTISPETAKSLESLIRKDENMPKSIEELEKQVGELTGQLTSANALLATEKARADSAEKAKNDMAAERDKAKEDCGKAQADLAAATDETIKVGDQEIKKSAVGEANFTLAKTLANERQTAQLEKRAAEEFPHVVGTAAEKALVLKVIDGKPEDDPTRKAIEQVLTACEKMTKAGFDRLGSTGGQTETEKAATEAFTTKVAEVRKANPNMKEHEAMEKVRLDHPDLFQAYQNGGADAPAN
jgi:hypothetical protein